MLTNRSFGSRRISSYIILLYDGLSTDSNDAVNEATLINSIGGRIITVAVGQSISYSEMLSISRKQYYTFSTSFLDDILNNILKETVPDNCTGRTYILVMFPHIQTVLFIICLYQIEGFVININLFSFK